MVSTSISNGVEYDQKDLFEGIIYNIPGRVNLDHEGVALACTKFHVKNVLGQFGLLSNCLELQF